MRRSYIDCTLVRAEKSFDRCSGGKCCRWLGLPDIDFIEFENKLFDLKNKHDLCKLNEIKVQDDIHARGRGTPVYRRPSIQAFLANCLVPYMCKLVPVRSKR